MAYSFPRGHENLNQRGSAVKCEGLWKNKTKSKYIEINTLWYSELPNFLPFLNKSGNQNKDVTVEGRSQELA